MNECGVPITDDFNGGKQEGVGYFQLTADRGFRCSSAKAFLTTDNVKASCTPCPYGRVPPSCAQTTPIVCTCVTERVLAGPPQPGHHHSRAGPEGGPEHGTTHCSTVGLVPNVVPCRPCIAQVELKDGTATGVGACRGSHPQA